MTVERAGELTKALAERFTAHVEPEEVAPGRFRFEVFSRHFGDLSHLERGDQAYEIVDRVLGREDSEDITLILLYGLFVARGLRTALQCREPFGKLLAAGLAFAFALQVFAIIGGVTRLLPLTGLTTPFMSQGGSSMICNWIIVGLLMVISHQVRRPVPTAAEYDRDLEATQVVRVA